VSQEYKVWSIINTDCDPSQPLTSRCPVDGGEGHGVPQKLSIKHDIPNAVFCVEDPRVPMFGHRLLVHSGNGGF
jgi:hypothetical protein